MQSSLDALAAQLERFVAHVREQTEVPGIAVAISNLEHRIYINVGTNAVGGSEQMTRHAQFRIGCVTKLLLAVVVLELVRDGELDLDLPIGEYLDELRGTPHGESVCVSHLLSHTSGYRGTNILEEEARSLTWGSFVDYLRAALRFFDAGAVFNYEHTEAVLLGHIVRRVTGQDSNTLIRETLLAPLGISVADCGTGSSRTTSAGHHDFDPATRRFRQTEAGPALSEFWRASFAQYAVSVTDLVTVAEALAAPSATAACGISAATITLLQRPAVTLPAIIGGAFADLLPVAFGYGTAHLRDGFLGRNGLSHGQCVGIRYDPGTRTCVAVGLNARMPHLRDYILTALCQLLTGRVVHRAPQSLPFGLAELTGTYVGGGRAMVTADRKQDRLVLEIGAADLSHKLRAELVVRENEEPILQCAVPQLSLGFFRNTHDNNIGLMLGLGAYKRTSGVTRK